VTPAELQHSGIHVVADLHGIARDKLCDAGALDALLRQAAQAAGATIVFSHFHAFGPGQGITGVVLLAESHISIHTWPESGFAALDIFMCGQAQPRHALALIEASLQPASSAVQELPRGYAVVNS
jgi:S-adenosylmethionine decarboxylase